MPQHTANRLRQRLQQEREAQGYSQSTLARMAGWKNYESIYQMETGKGGKMLEKIAQWAGALGFTLTCVRPHVLPLVDKMDKLDEAQLATLSLLLDSMTT